MTAERLTGRLLGVQIVGYEGAAKRIDTAATALWNRMTVEDLTSLDLAYAPPFAPVWDPILVAARQVAASRAQRGRGPAMTRLCRRGSPGHHPAAAGTPGRNSPS